MELNWVACRDGDVPEGAVFGGWDAFGKEPLYIGRAKHGRNNIVGKVHPSHHCCFVPYNGIEHKFEDYEVLVNPGNRVHLEWEYGSEGSVPENAVEGGRDSSGEAYYIGQHSHLGDTLPGKIQRSHRRLYVSYNGKEYGKKKYAVLIIVA